MRKRAGSFAINYATRCLRPIHPFNRFSKKREVSGIAIDNWYYVVKTNTRLVSARTTAPERLIRLPQSLPSQPDVRRRRQLAHDKGSAAAERRPGESASGGGGQAWRKNRIAYSTARTPSLVHTLERRPASGERNRHSSGGFVRGKSRKSVGFCRAIFIS